MTAVDKVRLEMELPDLNPLKSIMTVSLISFQLPSSIVIEESPTRIVEDEKPASAIPSTCYKP